MIDRVVATENPALIRTTVVETKSLNGVTFHFGQANMSRMIDAADEELRQRHSRHCEKTSTEDLLYIPDYFYGGLHRQLYRERHQSQESPSHCSIVGKVRGEPLELQLQ
ncbi:unnamed protein product [Amoebophrya sp. A25]|nr:unnamed protein product [Amoebophrya sp. A25]|eukprot:GSA25T00001824001.1